MFDNRFTSGAFVALILLISVVGVNKGHAETFGSVRLVSHDGTLDIAGDLVAVNRGFYTITTRLGDVQIPAHTVTCIGFDCPTAVVSITQLTETSAEFVARTFDPRSMESYIQINLPDEQVEEIGPFRLVMN